MTSLESVRPLFRFCQFFGVLPFRMEMEEETRRFKNLSFSWRYPITWWFIISSILSTTVIILIVSFLLSSPDVDNLPLVIKVTSKVVAVLYISQVFASRFWFAFRLTSLRKAIEFMHQVETCLTNKYPNGDQTNIQISRSINLRVLLGIIISCVGVRSVDIDINFTDQMIKFILFF